MSMEMGDKGSIEEEKKPIAVEFDGVLHAGCCLPRRPRSISSASVPGALQWLVETTRERKVVICSWRCLFFGGRRAMKRWLRSQLEATTGECWESTPRWLQDLIAETAFADPWNDEVRWTIKKFVSRRLGWPRHWPGLADARWVTTELMLLNGFPKFE